MLYRGLLTLCMFIVAATLAYGSPGDLSSGPDQALAFDFDHSGKLDHLVLYRPGTGVIWILKHNGDQFAPVFEGNGIGGYDFKSAADRVLAFDYDHSGKLDHLVLYRPGIGVMFILKHNGEQFTPVFEGNGIGGYDLKSAADRVLAFDYDHSGKQDHLVLYRPGIRVMWILKHNGDQFTPVFEGNGIGGYDLSSVADRAFAFDYDGTGNLDHLALYRPGRGAMFILKHSGDQFTPVYAEGSPGKGIGGYDLSSAVDGAFTFDFEHSGKLTHLVLYRPGVGVIWILKHSGQQFMPAFEGNGIGGYDLQGNPTIQVVGNLTCTSAGKKMDMAFTRIDIKRHDELLGSGGTDATGFFDFGVIVDESKVFSPQDRFMFTIALTDDYPGFSGQGHVRVYNELQHTLTMDIDKGSSLRNGTIDFGSAGWVTELGQGASQCGVFQYARKAYRDYQQKTGLPIPFNYNVKYWTSGGAQLPYTMWRETQWPKHGTTDATFTQKDPITDKTTEVPIYGAVVAHEFAHAVRDHFDGDNTHWNGDNTLFEYARIHGPCDSNHPVLFPIPGKEGFAFHEGWAEYWELYLYGPTARWNCPDPAGDMTVEGKVADALKALEGCTVMRGGTSSPVGSAGMVGVLEKNPGRIHSYREFRAYYDIEFPIHPGCP